MPHCGTTGNAVGGGTGSGTLEKKGVTGGGGGGGGQHLYTAVRFDYTQNGQGVVYAMGESWLWDGVAGTAPSDYQVNWAREFRYDSPRQRYIERVLSATQMTGSYVLSTAEVNTRYDGDIPYWSSDSSGSGTETGFELGLGKINDLGGTPAAEYYHTDMLGTTRFLTDETGAAVGSAAYTAFGELVSGTTGRFGYVGAFGYQTATSANPLDPYLTDMTFQHVGARYYDPGTGRFLQRDPIGIRGGANVYLYVSAWPTILVDPFGLYTCKQFWDDLADVGGVVTGIGCGITLYFGGATIPGGNTVLAGGVVWGLASAGSLGSKYGRKFPPGPPPPVPPSGPFGISPNQPFIGKW